MADPAQCDINGELQQIRNDNQMLRSQMNECVLKINQLIEENIRLQNVVKWYEERQENFPELSSRKVAKKKLKSDNIVTQDGDNVNSEMSSNDSQKVIGSTANSGGVNISNNTIDGNSASSNIHFNSTPNVENNIKHKKKILQTINTDIKTVKAKIKDANCNNFSIKQKGVNAPIKISILSSNEVNTVREALKEAKISFHEYKWEEEKSKCFIIKGLIGVNEDDLPAIKSELINNGIPSNFTVSLFITGFMRSNPNMVHNSLIKIVLPPNCDTAVIKNIKFIAHVAVNIEPFKSRSVVQCKKCQRFGHSAGGCMHTHRCVKCGSEHLRDKCPRTFDKSVKLHCCNCGGEHTANNLSACPFFIKNYANNSTTDASNPVLNSSSTSKAPSAARKPGFSYASILGENNNNSNKAVDNFNNKNFMLKLDKIFEMVTKHDQMLARLCSNV